MPGRQSKNRERSYAAPKPTLKDILSTRSEANRVTADFLRIDLQTSLTFSGLALHSPEGPRRERNRKNARRGYDTIVKLLSKVSFSEPEAQMVGENLNRLKSELQVLGEVF